MKCTYIFSLKNYTIFSVDDSVPHTIAILVYLAEESMFHGLERGIQLHLGRIDSIITMENHYFVDIKIFGGYTKQICAVNIERLNYIYLKLQLTESAFPCTNEY